jgi:hypothetical protein
MKPAVLVVTAIIVVGGFLGGVLLASSASAASGTGAATHATITVTGTGVVNGTPDTLIVQLAVSTNAASATDALDENNAEMATLERVLIRAAVRSSDLQTSNLQLSPNYDSSGDITSYGAEDDLTVTFHDIARSGSVIDAAAHAVGNDVRIQGISFSISNTSTLLKTARIEAVRNAEAEASDLARATKATLGPVVKITDQEQQTTPVVSFSYGFAADSLSAVPFRAGSEQLSVQVVVVYELGS